MLVDYRLGEHILHLVLHPNPEHTTVVEQDLAIKIKLIHFLNRVCRA